MAGLVRGGRGRWCVFLRHVAGDVWRMTGDGRPAAARVSRVLQSRCAGVREGRGVMNCLALPGSYCTANEVVLAGGGRSQSEPTCSAPRPSPSPRLPSGETRAAAGSWATERDVISETALIGGDGGHLRSHARWPAAASAAVSSALGPSRPARRRDAKSASPQRHYRQRCHRRQRARRRRTTRRDSVTRDMAVTLHRRG